MRWFRKKAEPAGDKTSAEFTQQELVFIDRLSDYHSQPFGTSGTPQISPQAFLRRFRGGISKADALRLVRYTLDAACQQASEDVLEAGLALGWKFGFPPEAIVYLNLLLIEDWHRGHEDIAFELATVGNRSSIPNLSHVIGWSPSYLKSDSENRALASKAVYSMRAIGGADAIEALKQVSEKETGHIKDLATRMLRELTHEE